jgi:hypothetical protein
VPVDLPILQWRSLTSLIRRGLNPLQVSWAVIKLLCPCCGRTTLAHYGLEVLAGETWPHDVIRILPVVVQAAESLLPSITSGEPG